MKIVIYTALIGNYDNLIEPGFNSNDIDFVCFSDQKIKSKNWDVRNAELNKMQTATHLNRFYKMNPHKFFPDYDVSIYVDSNIFIKSDISDFIKKSLAKHLIAAPRHLLRECIYDEAEVLKIQGRASVDTVNLQINRYKKEGMPSNFGLCEMNIIFRWHNHPNVINLMECWYKEFSKGVKRDQLSFFYCVWKLKMQDSIKHLSISSRKRNDYFMAVPHLNERIAKKILYKIKILCLRLKRKIKL